jgi:glycosyltransferase involved in cell wall biosynthesis
LDIIHDVGSFLPFFSKKLTPPVLTTFQHHAAPSSLRDYVQGFPVPLVFQKEPFADRVIAASEFSAKQVREEYGCRDVTVIPNGVDTSMYTPPEEPRLPSESGITLLFVGPLTERKNIKSLLTSTHLLTKQLDQKIELRIAGKGPQENELRRYVDELGMSSSVTFLGHVSDNSELAAEYQSADCFVFPSLLEGFGMVVVEALACGTPVAASNIEPLVSIVDDAGNFFDPSDPEDIAATVAGILEDQQRYSSLCAAAVDRGQRFDWGRIANEYIEVYEEMSRS